MATLHVVMAVSIGLGLDREEAAEMLCSAFPEFDLWGNFLDMELDIFEVNNILYELGLPLLGNLTEE